MRQTVLNLALPAIGEQILAMTVGMVSTYMVGHLGANSLAAVGLANQAVFVAQTIAVAIATGTTALVARQFGANDSTGAQRTLQQSVLAGVVSGLFITLIMASFASQTISFFGAEIAVREIGTQYLRIAVLSFPLQGVMFVGNGALRGSGDTRTPLFVMLAVNVVNIAVTYTLIEGLFGIPSLGVRGAAIGAATANTLGGLVLLSILLHGRGNLRLMRNGWLPDWTVIRRVVNVGLPAGVEQLLMRVGGAVFVKVVASLGTSAVAAHSVAMNVQSMCFMPAFGFWHRRHHPGRPGPGRRTAGSGPAWRSSSHWCLCLIMLILLGIGLILWAPYIIAIFIDDPTVIALGAPCNRILGYCEPIVAVSIVFSGTLRGAGDTRFTMLVMGISMWLVRVPLSFVAAGPLGWGLQGVWIAMAVEMAFRAGAYVLRYRSGAWTRLRI